MEPPFSATLSYLGTLIELGTCGLIAALVLGLRRESREHEFFGFWTWAGISMCVAIGAIAVRYNVTPLVENPRGPLVTLLYLFYQVGKLLFFLLVALGVWTYVQRKPVSRSMTGWLTLGSVAYGVVSVIWSRDLNRIVMLQAVAAAPLSLIAAWQVSALPADRRELGDGVLGTALLVQGGLWILYFFAFARVELDVGPWDRILGFLASYNSFFDAGLLIMLGIGMVLALIEHTHRDAEAAQIRRIHEVTAAQWRLAETLQAAHDGIVTLDKDRRIEELNEAAAVVLGADAPSARGRLFDEFIGPDRRGDLWADLSLTVRRSEAHPPVASRRELTGVRSDGTEFPLEVSLSSYGDGGTRGFVVVIRDLTEQRQVQADQERMQRQLAQTARLETVGRMVSGVAHEINNPLTAIIAFAQDLLLAPRTEEDREALTVIMQQAQRCRVIVGDLLIFARSKRDERRRVLPADLVRRVGRVFERDASRYGVTFSVTVADELPAVDIDPVGIEQVLANLLTNAFQASPKGGTVVLRVRADGDRLEMAVEDEGSGISAEAMRRLFEPFYTTKAPGQGTGLGLSVSHAIVEQHGGTIDAENRRDPPNGARFTVRLPFVDRRGKAAEPEEAAPTEAPAPATNGSGVRRVLVIDDEPAIRSAIRRVLERRGWEVNEAADGREATLMLEIGGQLADYDVVVTDLRMPGMSGIELYRWAETHHPGLLNRLVVVTGDTASPAIAEFLQSLRAPYLQKPFDMRALLEVLDRVGHLGVIVLGYGLALAIGLSLGLLGGGGSILTVPVLVYVMGLDMKAAVPMSLVVVGVVSTIGGFRHHRAGNIRWDAALAFAPAATVGAIVGSRLASSITGRTQLQIFALLMFAAALSMYRPPSAWLPAESGGGRNWLLIGLAGFLVGGLTGLLGVGGGFLYVPALVLLCAIPMRTAVGTSLVLIVVSCITAFIGHRGWVAMDWRLLGLFTALGAVGVILGTALSRHIEQERLRKAFAGLLVVMSLLVFLRPR